MLLDREILPTTIMDDGFNVIAGLFLDGRPPLMVDSKERVWPRIATAWRDEGPFILKEGTVVTPKGVYTAKLVVDRTEELEVVWAGNMPDQKGGFSKGELLSDEGYENSATANLLERARLSIMFGKTPGTKSSQYEDN